MSPIGDGSSSDQTLRYHAPSVIAEAWRRANHPLASASARFGRRVGFVEIVLRYLVAVLSAEVDGRGRPSPPAWAALKKRLDTPTLGMWASAAAELSREVLSLPAPITTGLAEVLRTRAHTGDLVPTPGSAALSELIDLRNAHAHGEAPSEGLATRLLAETEGPFRTFLAALRPIRRHVLWCVTDIHPRADGTAEAKVVAFRGAEPSTRRPIVLTRALPRWAPFLVGPRGEVLLLDPLLSFAEFVVQREAELRLFKCWKGVPFFSDPVEGDNPLPLPATADRSAEAWIAKAHAHAVQEGVVAGADLEVLLDPDRAEPAPEVPGYTLLARIGRGASGRVYLGRAESGEPREVAVKVLDHVLVADTAWRARIRREYETMRRLHSPGVVKVYDFLPDAPAGPTIVMEYVRGMDLQATVARAPLDVDTAVTLCDEVLQALREAHDNGVVHRDIKPSNVLRDTDGRARVLDFGIARVQGDATLTRTSDGLGTLAFAAPEQREGRAVDPRADVYGVGRLLGFLVSGSTRWEDHAACLPGALQSVCRRATQDDPAERFPDAEAFRAALRRAREAGWAGAPIGAGQPLSPTMRVENVLVRLDPGLWVLRGRDEAMDEAVGLLVAERNEIATGALQRALQALGEARRRELGVHRVQHTSDGLRWCTLPAADPTAVAREILAPPKVAPPPPPPPPKVAPSGGSALSGFASGAMAISALMAGATPVGLLLGLGAVAAGGPAKRVAVPPYLADWAEPDGTWTPQALGVRLDDLALVVHAQGQALGMPLDAEGWLELRRKPLRAASEVLTDPVTRWPAPLAAHLHKTRTRGRALQAVLHLQAWLEAGVTEPPGRAERAGIDLAVGVLHAVALLGASLVPPERLAPWVFPGPEGWCARGTMERFWHPLGRGPT